jgi:hypothetical protein
MRDHTLDGPSESMEQLTARLVAANESVCQLSSVHINVLWDIRHAREADADTLELLTQYHRLADLISGAYEDIADIKAHIGALEHPHEPTAAKDGSAYCVLCGAVTMPPTGMEHVFADARANRAARAANNQG